mmetsp:Transcript_11535/g.14534  ORF Transcript_11535/g.14534 Transcript_11535/m.14534 type:complete len:415 (+) Transcript_11535:140-1384(+)
MSPNSYLTRGLKHRRMREYLSATSSSTTLSSSPSESLSLSSSSSSSSISSPSLEYASFPQQDMGKPLLSFIRKPGKVQRKLKAGNIVTWFLKLLLNLAVYLFGLAIVSFLSYLFCMSLYNGRSVRDPCMVAQGSKDKIYQSLTDVKRDITIQTNLTHVATVEVAKSPSIIDVAGSPFREEVPKIIHQQWKNETVPKKFMKWRRKWLNMYPKPEYTHMLWTDKNGRQLIKEHYPWFLETYDGYKHNINRADAARYFILHYYGGIYADLDYEAQSNFYEFLPPNQVAMVESPYYWNEKTQNCLMSSPKHDPFWVDLFAVLMKNAEREEVLEATGPILLDQAMEYSVHPSYILPCENFQRVPLGEYDQTLWTTIYDREIMFRLKPISKNCGYYSNDQCHFGRHHNTVSYRTTTGKVL